MRQNFQHFTLQLSITAISRSLKFQWISYPFNKWKSSKAKILLILNEAKFIWYVDSEISENRQQIDLMKATNSIMII